MAPKDFMWGTAVVLAVSCAVITTALSVHRELEARTVARNAGNAHKPVPVSDWQQYTSGGHRIGSQSPALTVVEFIDFECPYCGEFAVRQLRPVLDKYPSVAFVIRQRPIPYHRFAIPAARAAECADAQGKYAEYYDAVFTHQDSLGLLSFSELAHDAGVGDIAAFDRCNSGSARLPTLDADTAAANRLGIHATPAFIVDGLLLTGLPDSAAFDRMIVDGLHRQH